MKKRITIQDIADSLGLSRNTVSKALNNTGVLADDTRRKILDKAAEMGYRRFLYPDQEFFSGNTEPGELALLTQNMPYGSHFGTYALNTFQEKISQNHYRLTVFPVREEEVSSLTLPLGFDKSKTAGILCMEMFHPEYIKMLSTLSVPLLFIDASYDIDFTAIDADFLLMENRNSIFRLTDSLIRKGFQRLAFAGEYRHCRSFFERYQWFTEALSKNNLSPCTAQFADNDVFADASALDETIRRVFPLPEVFVCANDFTAIRLIHALRRQNIKIPEDICVTGFDNSSESKIIEPSLTTVSIPSEEMGYIAADLLLSRIRKPDTPYRLTYVRTKVEYRDSTGNRINFSS